MKKLTTQIHHNEGNLDRKAITCFRACKLACHGSPDMMVENIAYMDME